MADLKAELQKGTRSAILAYNMNRAQIVQAAFKEGGPEAVAQLEDEFAALCNADFSLARAALNANHRQYRHLLSEAAANCDLLHQSLIALDSAAEVLDLMGKTVTILGRLLVMLTA